MRWGRAASRSTRCTSTSTASPATSTGPWKPTAARGDRGDGAARGRRRGADYKPRIVVTFPADREQERYPLLEERMEVDLSGLSEDEVARLLTVVERAVDQVCTVGRTLKSGTKVTFEVVDAGVS